MITNKLAWNDRYQYRDIKDETDFVKTFKGIFWDTSLKAIYKTLKEDEQGQPNDEIFVDKDTLKTNYREYLTETMQKSQITSIKRTHKVISVTKSILLVEA
jgi:hypothetical protein